MQNPLGGRHPGTSGEDTQDKEHAGLDAAGFALGKLHAPLQADRIGLGAAIASSPHHITCGAVAILILRPHRTLMHTHSHAHSLHTMYTQPSWDEAYVGSLFANTGQYLRDYLGSVQQ